MIFYYLWKRGLSARADSETLRFFFGLAPNPLYLSRRWPLVTSVNWARALLSPAYAKAVVGWLNYRIELYDGLQG